MSTTMYPYLLGYSFDPEVSQAMGKAYDKARKLLLGVRQPEVVQEVIAQRIIDVAKTGERNADRIYEGTLSALGLERCG